MKQFGFAHFRSTKIQNYNIRFFLNKAFVIGFWRLATELDFERCIISYELELESNHYIKPCLPFIYLIY